GVGAATPPAPLRAQVPARPTPKGQPDAAGDAHHEQWAERGVADASALLSHRLGELGEEVPGEARRALADHQPQHREEGDEGDGEEDGTHPGHPPVDDLPVQERGVEVHPEIRPGPFCTAVTSTRAAALRRKVVAKRINPSPASAPMWTLLTASANSLAITAGRL